MARPALSDSTSLNMPALTAVLFLSFLYLCLCPTERSQGGWSMCKYTTMIIRNTFSQKNGKGMNTCDDGQDNTLLYVFKGGDE